MLQGEQLTLDAPPSTSAYAAQFAANRTWGWAAERAMRKLAKSGAPFSADDFARLMEGVEEQPTSPNAIGALFQAWARAGEIRRVGYCKSTQARRNGGVIAVWRAAV